MILFELGIKDQSKRGNCPVQVQKAVFSPSTLLARLALESIGCEHRSSRVGIVESKVSALCFLRAQSLLVCRRQQYMMRVMLLRGKEFRDLPIGHISTYTNYYSLPTVMPMLIFAIHGAKANKEGKHADCRAVTYGNELLRCPLLHLAIHVACRLFLGNGQPLPESVAETTSW